MAAFIKNKKLYVLDDSGASIPFLVDNNDDSTIKEFFLLADRTDLFSFDDFYNAVTSPISMRLIRVYLLNPDETIKLDVTEYLTGSCNVDVSYNKGLTRSSSFTLVNTDNIWTPDPTKGFLWKGTKFRIDSGLYYDNMAFWYSCGIFVSGDPTIDGEKQTIQLPLHDKFSLLDGAVGGKIDSDFKISVGTPIKVAIEMCLTAKKENGEIYDSKPVYFPANKESITTPYTITKSPGITYGEIIKELCAMISCDVYYNEYGNLVVTGDSDDTPLENRAVVWHFDDSTPLYQRHTSTIQFSTVVNKVTVLGAIENGYRYNGIAINDKASSRTNIHMTEPNPEVIEDSNIIGDVLCSTRAKYELKNKTLLGLQNKFECVYIPTVTPNNLVTWTNIEKGYLNEPFFVNSVSFDLLSPSLMNISLTNIREIPI